MSEVGRYFSRGDYQKILVKDFKSIKANTCVDPERIVESHYAVWSLYDTRSPLYIWKLQASRHLIQSLSDGSFPRIPYHAYSISIQDNLIHNLREEYLSRDA